MEKTASTRAIVKGSTSTAAEVIAVDVDPEALCCPRCLHPLVPPVLQCAGGHLVCSSCHDNLQDKNKCASCFVSTGYTRYSIPTSYSHCRGVERILQSVRVACRNAIHGCAAGKMLYHEKEEHEKTCPIKAGSVQRQEFVLKMGRCGSAAGDPFEMDVDGVDRIVKVFVWHRDVTLDAMLVVYERYGREEQTKRWGIIVPPCNRSEICLESDEYLTNVKGHIGRCGNTSIVKSLTFVSNRQTFGPYGPEEGERFNLPAAGGKIVGFHGRYGHFIYALGTVVMMVI